MIKLDRNQIGGGLDETTRQASGLGDTGPGPIVGFAQCGAGALRFTHPSAGQPSSTVWEYCSGLSCCPGRLSWTSRRAGHRHPLDRVEETGRGA
jgi:hypothetical protein